MAMNKNGDGVATPNPIETTIASCGVDPPSPRGGQPRPGEVHTCGVSIGRFVVLGSLGMGGMGAVLSAWDPQLDRKVALKLFHDGLWRRAGEDVARERLVREAQAMARLSHPNVVALYEVVFTEPDGYLVMEQVEGTTLREWLVERPRSWEEIVDLLVAAGAGLAAAHGTGLVHHDFKPENVLVGADGRPRVSDFGLAGEGIAGAGTKPYMAPEQLAGGKVDARADQYAFCVTLWEALHGERPPPDAAPPAVRKAPRWLYAAITRGLAARPEDRWPSMDALLGAIRGRCGVDRTSPNGLFSRPAMRFRVLGALRLEDATGQPVEIKAKKCRGLLAYLALHPRRAETRERLAALLWGGMGEERARANLRQCVSSLREHLGDEGGGVLVSDGDVVRLELGVAVDACELRALARSEDPSDWRRAAELYHGELLADLVVEEEPYEEWLSAERREIHGLICAQWARLARALRQAGDDSAAEGALACWLSLDGASEEAHRELMKLYLDSGRRAKALAQLERCKEALAHAYGVEPDATTVALARVVAAAPPPPRPTLPLPAKPSIAVLPFATPSAPADGWLGDGMAEDIIVALSRFDRLLVIARQSSFVFRGENDVRDIGRALGVHYVLSGTVRRAGGRVRMAILLADTDSGQTTWAQSHDIAADEIFVAQQEIVQVVVATLAGRVEADRVARLRRGSLANLEAYDCLLRAKAHHHRYTAADNATSRALLERALALDPELALAHAWLACVLVQGIGFGASPDVIHLAYEHVRCAVAVEEDESECHRILASYYLMTKRHDEAERHQTRALSLNPNDDRIVCQQGEMLMLFGRAAEGLPWIERAKRLNPYHADGMFYDHGRALYHVGDAAQARRELLAIRAPRAPHHAYLAACCARLGDRPQARAYAAEARRAAPSLTPETFVNAQPYRTAAAATTLLEDLRAAWPPVMD